MLVVGLKVVVLFGIASSLCVATSAEHNLDVIDMDDAYSIFVIQLLVYTSHASREWMM